MNSKELKHESFVQIAISRVQSSKPTALYGSNIKTNTLIKLTVSESTKRYDLHRVCYFADKTIMEIYMSPAQFAELITCMNIGSGVPGTLTYLMGKHIEYVEDENIRLKIEKDFKEDMIDLNRKISSAIKNAESLLSKPNLTKKELREIIGTLSSIRQDLNSNIPFLQQSFNEAMDKTVSAAKTEIDTFVTHLTMTLGQQSLIQQIESTGEVPQIEITGLGDE